MLDLAEIRSRVVLLSPDAPVDAVADVLTRLEYAAKYLREMRSQAEERILEYVTENGPVEIGDVKYYAGTEKKTVCRDTRGAAEAVLDATAGDLDTFCQQLSAQPFKYGALKLLLGQERWAKFFDVVETPDLKTGKPERKLLSVNQKYAGAGR